MRKVFCALLVLLLTFPFSASAALDADSAIEPGSSRAADRPQTSAPSQPYLPLVSPSAILVEQTTGKTLYGKNEHTRMYPASMTKILTAVVAIEWLNPDDVVTVGREIFGLPADYSNAVHFEGETITVRNLLRALIIRSSNETGNILALNTIRAIEGVESIPPEEAERRFLTLMNEKAISLGATDSNFNNTYGYHSTNHYSTAADMALISRAFMEDELLASIAAERVYEGDSLEGRVYEGAKVNEYYWESHNELLLGGANGYPYADGIKTGFHDDAGDCVAASATRNGMKLVAVVFNSEDPGRWQDSRLMFDYGFETFKVRQYQEDAEYFETKPIFNPRLGAETEVEVYIKGEASALLSEDELARITRTITYNADFIAEEKTESGADQIKTPFEEGAEVGTVVHELDGEIIHEGAIYLTSSAEERTFDTDMDYYIAEVKANVFSLKGLPYWIGALGLLIGIMGIAAAVSGRRKSRGDRYRGASKYKPYKRGRY